jgi:hypothetical protein
MEALPLPAMEADPAWDAVMQDRNIRTERRRLAEQIPTFTVRKLEDSNKGQKRKLPKPAPEPSSEPVCNDGPKNYKKMRLINVKVSLIFMDGRVLKVGIDAKIHVPIPELIANCHLADGHAR